MNYLVEETIMQINGKASNDAAASTHQEVSGRRKYRHKRWISIKKLVSIQETQNRKTSVIKSWTRRE